MELIVDRFEEEVAVCEDENKNIINIRRSSLPNEVKPGDIVIYKNGKYYIDNNKTKNRKEYIKNLTKDLWE